MGPVGAMNRADTMSGLHNQGTTRLARIMRYGLASHDSRRKRDRHNARTSMALRLPLAPPATALRIPPLSRSTTLPMTRSAESEAESRLQLPSPCVTHPAPSRPTIRWATILPPVSNATTSPICNESKGTGEIQRQSPCANVPHMLSPRQGAEAHASRNDLASVGLEGAGDISRSMMPSPAHPAKGTTSPVMPRPAPG